jgi:D-3-phosphoglycerate dehydrogenase
VNGRRRVLITCPQMQRVVDQFRDRLDRSGIEIDLPEVVQALSERELMPIIDRYDGMIAGDDEITASVIARAERMRTIAKWGVGVDGIDLDAARARGISVTNTPGAFGHDVADVAAGYLVMLARGLHRVHDSVVDGGWYKPEGRRLAGSTLGIAGFGSVGREVARRGVGFGMGVAAHDVASAARTAAQEMGVAPVGLDGLFSRSDYLVLCTPLTPQTHHMVNAETLSLMPEGAHLINVARGPLVDEAALVAALHDGQLAGAALDVFEQEPLPAASPLREIEGCVFGSHNASNTREGVMAASAEAVDNLIQELDRQ